MRVIILDTETTGFLMPSSAPLESQPKVIEVGLIVAEHGNAVGRYNWLINPGIPIPAEATKVNGITDEMVADKLSFAEVLSEIAEVFLCADVCLAHNAPFDTGVINFEMQRLGKTFPWPAEIICSVEEYRPMFGRRPKLIELYERMMKKKLAQTHRASDDAFALYEALKEDKFFDRLESISK